MKKEEISNLKKSIEDLAEKKHVAYAYNKIYEDRLIVFEFDFYGISYAIDCEPVNEEVRLVPRDGRIVFFTSKIINYESKEKIFLYKNKNFSYRNEKINLNNKIIQFLSFEEIVVYCILTIQEELEANYFMEYISHNFREKKSTDIKINCSEKISKKMMGMIETLDYIRLNECSLSRYGDGEYALASDINEHRKFQKNSISLNFELRDILSKNKKGLLVGIAGPLFHDPFWNNFWPKYWDKLSYLFEQEIYGDSFITRPEFFQIFGLKGVDAWKKIWFQKSVCFIYGEGSRFDHEHELFSEVREKGVILSKPLNAYSEMDFIINKVKKEKKYDIYLIALGQTATVLSSKLHSAGFRSLDIGHINASYDMVFHNKPKPENLEYVKKVD